MYETTVELLLGDDPDAIEEHAYALLHQGPHSAQYDQARTVLKVAKQYRNYSDFEVPGGPLAVQSQTERLIAAVKKLFDNELDRNVARRLLRAMFVLEQALPGEPPDHFFQYLLLERVLAPGSKGKLERLPCQ